MDSYELTVIEDEIKQLLSVTVTLFELKANNNTLKREMKCNNVIGLSMPNKRKKKNERRRRRRRSMCNRIDSLPGFRSKMYDANASV